MNFRAADDEGTSPVDEILDGIEPDFWTDVLGFLGHAGENLVQIAVILLMTFLASLVLRAIIRRVVHRIVHTAKSRANVDDTQALDNSPLANMRLVQRTRTLGAILQNIVSVALVIIAILLIISVVAPSLLGSLTLLTAAIGAGLGFGAQNIVKDVLNGLFIVIEDQVGIGDVVDLGLASGVVEQVSVRITRVRDANGTLWYVRNGEITRIGNMSQGWARAIIDVGLPADVDVPRVEAILLTTAQSLESDTRWRTRIIDRAEVWGLESVQGEALVVRVVIKTRANAQEDVARELRMRLRRAVLEEGLELPSLTGVVLDGPDGARRVRGANPPRTRPTSITTPPAAEIGFWRRRKTAPSGADSERPDSLPASPEAEDNRDKEGE